MHTPLLQTILSILPLFSLGLSQNDDRSLAYSIVNQARQAKGVQPLAWSPDLAAYAQFWANQMASGLKPFSHATGPYRPQQGEVLYEQQSGQCDTAYDNPLQTAMHAWLSQEVLYDNQPITTGHEHWLHWCKVSRMNSLVAAKCRS